MTTTSPPASAAIRRRWPSKVVCTPRRRQAGKVAAPQRCVTPSAIRMLAPPTGVPSIRARKRVKPAATAMSRITGSSASRGKDSCEAMPWVSGAQKPSTRTSIQVSSSLSTLGLTAIPALEAGSFGIGSAAPSTFS